jgi:hypothetical protein
LEVLYDAFVDATLGRKLKRTMTEMPSQGSHGAYTSMSL